MLSYTLQNSPNCRGVYKRIFMRWAEFWLRSSVTAVDVFAPPSIFTTAMFFPVAIFIRYCAFTGYFAPSGTFITAVLLQVAYCTRYWAMPTRLNLLAPSKFLLFAFLVAFRADFRIPAANSFNFFSLFLRRWGSWRTSCRWNTWPCWRKGTSTNCRQSAWDRYWKCTRTSCR